MATTSDLLGTLRSVLEDSDMPPISDSRLKLTINGAISLYVRLRWPNRNYTQDSSGFPVLDALDRDWIVQAAIEMVSRMGAEGQVSHVENSISRGYDSGVVSEALRRAVIPIASIASSGSRPLVLFEV